MGSITEFRGAKGGGSSHTPVEAPNSLRSISYFRILDLLSEGEIGGLVNGLQSVYLDDTPVANADGTLNFTGVAIQQRTGTQTQDVIAGWSATENEIAVSTELKSDAPWVRALSNTELSAVRITLQVDALQQQNTKNGDVNGYTVQYAIDVSTDGGAYQTVQNSAFAGKTTTPYQRSTRIDLPKATAGWNIRVRRLTANANSNTIADTTRVVSYTEIVDARLRYPNSALIAISGDASAFSNIPSRAYEVWGRSIRVPSNYNPQTRAYTGVWDGTFQTTWTDNPAWVYYDMVTNDRFGLGDLIDESLIDKWELYRIAQYCDQLVDDGNGGQEPRYTCNCYLQTAADAYKLLGDMASIWNGLSYWAGGAVTASADMPSDPVYTYTAANVVGGLFNYQGTARQARFTTALVTWNDPSNAYTQVPEYVEDPDGLARYGLQQNAFVAFGCTSQGQARRAGKWSNLTSRLETDSVTFQVALDGLMCVPGQIINVQDPKRAGARQGGRIRSATVDAVTVDKAPDQAAIGDTLTVNLPTGSAETRTISAINGQVISVSQPFSQPPAATAVWAVSSATLALQTFRVLTVSEDSQAGNGDGTRSITFTITAIQHNASKFANIDNGTVIQILPISRLPVGVQAPPTAVQVTSHEVVQQGISNTVMTISWTPPAGGAARYVVEWQKDSGTWVQAGTVQTNSIDIIGIYTGTYTARVTAYNSGNTASLAALSDPTPLLGKTGAPPALTSLTATSLPFGIALDWGFPAGAEDSQRTEIWSSTNAVRPDDAATIAYKLGDYAYPGNHSELHGLSAGASLFFWGRIVDKAGNIGPWYPAVGAVNGQSISDPNALQDYWAGTIGRSALTQDLLTDIDAAATVTDDVQQLQTDLQGQATELQQHADELTQHAQGITALQQSDSDQNAQINQLVTAGQGYDSSITNLQQTTQQQANQLSTLSTTVGQQSANITSLQQTQAGQASQLTNITVTLNEPMAGSDTSMAGANTRKAGANTAVIARATADYSQVSQIQALQAQTSTNTASITNVSTALTNLTSSTASQIATLQASTAANTAAVQTNATAIADVSGKVSSSYSIKTQVAANGQRYLAGIAIGVDYAGGDVTSQVLVNAGTFAVFDASSGSAPATFPFVIQGGQTFINQALIGTGWITNAMIGNQIASTAMVNGQPAWEINKSGLRIVRGLVHTINEDSTSWRLINNANGVVVIEMGGLN